MGEFCIYQKARCNNKKNSLIIHVCILNTSNRYGWVFHQLRVQIYFLRTAFKLLPLIKRMGLVILVYQNTTHEKQHFVVPLTIAVM